MSDKRAGERNEEKSEKVLESAHSVFLRYGYRRTTMGDLSKAAGISRPALYLLFRNKEEIFKAVTTRYFTTIYEKAEKRLMESDGEEEALEAVMSTWIIEPYLEIAGNEEAYDIYEVGQTLLGEIKDKFQPMYIAQLQRILKKVVREENHYNEGRGTIKETAELLAYTSRGLRREVRDVEHLRELLTHLRRLCLRGGV